MARATNDLNSVCNVLGPGILHGVGNSLLFVLVVTLMLITDVKLTLLALIPLPFITVAAKISLKHIFKIFKQAQAQYSTITAKAQENIAGMRVVKAYVQETNESQEFDQLSLEYLDLNLKLTRIQAMLFSSLTFLMGVGTIILIWYGGHLVVGDVIEIGDFIAFTVWLGMLAWPMISFGWIMNMIQQGAASMDRLMEIMDVEPSIKDEERTDKSIRDFSGEIEFKNVSFSYGDNLPVILENINIKIQAGQTIAITGPTGSGKTTLVNLIPRLLEASEGQVLIDGVDVRNIPLYTLRKHIGVVPQETFLFSESISNNISFGLKNAAFEEIEKAASISTIRSDLEDFSDRYETLVGERGITLSGGQKQRTALSRAIIRKPRILILDDALSSVDSHTEEKILKQFNEFNGRNVCIIISQRISTIKNADVIYVLKEGKVIERGTHEDLLKSNGFYTELYKKQLLEKALEKM